MIIIMGVSLVMAIGPKNILDLFTWLYEWATVGHIAAPRPAPTATAEKSFTEDPNRPTIDDMAARYRAAQEAKAAAKEAVRQEKERIKAEKAAAKEAARAEKERIKAEKAAAKAAEKELRGHTRMWGSAEPAAQPASPAPVSPDSPDSLTGKPLFGEAAPDCGLPISESRESGETGGGSAAAPHMRVCPLSSFSAALAAAFSALMRSFS